MVRIFKAEKATITAKKIKTKNKPSRQTNTHKAQRTDASGDVEVEVTRAYARQERDHVRVPEGHSILARDATINSRHRGSKHASEKREGMEEITAWDDVTVCTPDDAEVVKTSDRKKRVRR